MKITEALMLEHITLRGVFQQIEHLWPQIDTLKETSTMASLVEGLLQLHGSKEENLLYLAYDHVLEDRGELERMSQDHVEIDAHLQQVHQAANVQEAKQLLRLALSNARRHFLFEEVDVFPAVEQALKADTLERLARKGKWWLLGEPAGIDPGLLRVDGLSEPPPPATWNAA